MAARSPVKMMSELGFNGDDLGKELGYLLREQRMQESTDRERELSIYRSGSAPPTVEGSLNAIAGLTPAPNGNRFLTEEEEIRSDPAYLNYYYKQANLNPRLPPPVLSKEGWRSMQRLGGIGDRRKAAEANVGNSGSLFSRQTGLGLETEVSAGEWANGGGDGLIGLSLGRQKSFAEIFRDDLGRMPSGHSSNSASHNTFGCIQPLGSTDSHIALNHDIASQDGQQPSRHASRVVGIQSTAPQTFASVLGSSLSRNPTTDPKLAARVPSPSFAHAGGRLGANDMKNNGVPYRIVESDDILVALSGMSLSSVGTVDTDGIAKAKQEKEVDAHRNFIFDFQSAQNFAKQRPLSKNSEQGHSSMSKSVVGLTDSSTAALGPNGSVDSHIPTVFSHSYMKSPSTRSVARPDGSPGSTNAAFTSYGQSGYSTKSALPSMLANHIGPVNLPPLFENAAASAFAALGMDSRAIGNGCSSGLNLNGSNDLQSFNRLGNHSAAAALHSPLLDPQHLQYLGAANFNDPSLEGAYMGSSYLDLIGMQEAYLGSLLQPYKQYGAPYLGNSGGSNHGYYGNPAFGQNISYPGSHSPVGPGSPMRHTERSLRLPSGLSSFTVPWHSELNGNLDEGFPPTLLEEFKNSKTRSFELSDIAGHVVEFSADQYGSRFIQQKLETATTEEKNMVFEEIMPQALSLMTDVFGNYVVQKFFEHGTAAQIRELASHLNTHVLTLSLQMYGCRVIQKAIEVVNMDQQTKMVAELDGHVMRCVRDQNGNHVIQKCIECIPHDAIQFIISSFYDQVVTLSTHPYGCRVIQRVLEHCDDPKTQQIVMDEIMQCVCMLAQDQYGNYVIQHVLQHGKPHERSEIIKKLAGQIVEMSQQKFASNVVEKCLTFGGPIERQILVNEMLGSTDENEPLQAMMKDQFANYVVQKVLETCNDQQRHQILSRIKVHLTALKKYTYGKHIVTRVEKLVAAGERRIGLQPSYAS